MRGQRALDACGGHSVVACHVDTSANGETSDHPSSKAKVSVPAPRDVDEKVGKLTREQLAVFWQRRWRRAPPKGISRRLLECNAAWLLQAEAQGAITAATRRRLNELAGAVDDDSNKREHPARESAPGPKNARRALRPGSRLVRQWKGQTHVVDVVEGSFSYDGRTFNSLTAIAFEITGARWSGPRFFGLDRTKRNSTRDAATSDASVAAQEPSSNTAASQNGERSDA